MAMELVDDAEAGNDPIARSLVGGEDLDLRSIGLTVDAAVTIEAAEAGKRTRALNEALGLAVEDSRLIARAGGDWNPSCRLELCMVERDAGHERGLGVALGDHQPGFGDAAEEIGHERRLEVLED